MNKRPFIYYQTDPRWKSVDYSAPGENTTIGGSGCGPTCAAMIAQTLTGKTITPVDACKWSLKNGYKAVNQGTYYAFFKPFFSQYGIKCEQLNSSSVYGKKTASVHTEAFSRLQQGDYIIACMGKGNWTSSGHFVVLWWADGKVHINDPASSKPQRIHGDLNIFKSQVKYYWAVDARKHNSGGGPVNTTAKRVVSIPTSDIAKIELYVNTNKKTLTTIMKETGADYGMNGGLFEWTWRACPLLKVGGSMVSEDPYTAWGYGWNDGFDIEMASKHSSYQNYISCIDLINPYDGCDTKLSYHSDVGGKRGRTAMGLFGDNLILYCTKDGSSAAKKPEDLRDEMRGLGCDTCIMLDGGGSSQCSFKGKTIVSSRKVHNYVLVYLKGNKNAEKESNSVIKTVQTGLNSRYKSGLDIDGKFGPASKKAMTKAVQTEINKLYGGNLAVDGSFGPASQKACPNIKKVTKNALAWLIQACLAVKGYDIDLDGSYGGGTETIVRKFQKASRLSADGVCGPNTMTKLLW